jgi:hypothetical protein
MTKKQFKDKANKLFAEKKFSEAIDIYTTAISYNPQNPALYSNRAFGEYTSLFSMIVPSFLFLFIAYTSLFILRHPLYSYTSYYSIHQKRVLWGSNPGCGNGHFT